MASKILLSTDIGSDVDDALAVLAMINAGMDLSGIYVVNGDVKSRGYIARHLVDLAGKDITVAMADAKPIGGNVAPYYYFEDSYIDDKFIDEDESSMSHDIAYKDPHSVGILTHGTEELARKLFHDKHTVFSIAPLTSIARLVEEHSQVLPNIERLYVMGCRFTQNGDLEHNVRYDIPAAQIVFSSDIPITVVSGNLCQKYRMPTTLLEQIKSPAGKYVKRMAQGFVNTKAAIQMEGDQLEARIDREIFNTGQYVRTHPGLEGYNRLQYKQRVLVNLNDPYYATLEPEKYTEQYGELLAHLRDPEEAYPQGEKVAQELEELVPKHLSVADVYVPYCYSHPERLQTAKGTVSISSEGVSYIRDGEKHTIIEGVDYQDFEKFLQANIR
jgi:inosine-uridine nucleoside N-ribohydrolase